MSLSPQSECLSRLLLVLSHALAGFMEVVPRRNVVVNGYDIDAAVFEECFSSITWHGCQHRGKFQEIQNT